MTSQNGDGIHICAGVFEMLQIHTIAFQLFCSKTIKILKIEKWYKKNSVIDSINYIFRILGDLQLKKLKNKTK